MTDRVLHAVLGWANDAGITDGENLQLYALDAGPGPRWMNPPHGRTVETALREHGIAYEGDRFLLIHVGDRHAATLAEGLAAQIADLFTEEEP